MNPCLSIFFVLMTTCAAWAQQLPLHTQFRTNSFMVNPAIPIVARIVPDVKGEFDMLRYQHAFGFSYRDQWWGFGNERPRTFSAHYQFYGSLPDRQHRNWDFWSGAYFLKDAIGPTATTGGYLTGSLHKNWGIDQHLYVGFSLGMVQYTFDANALYFGAQGVENDPVLADDRLTLIDPGFGVFYSNELMFAGASIPRLVVSTVDGRRDRIHHFYSVFGTTVRNWWIFNLVEPSIWFRWARYNSPHVDLGVRVKPRTGLPVWASISLDNSYAIRLNVGLLTSLGNSLDLQLGFAYTNRVSFFNELGGVLEVSNSFLFR